MKTGAIFFITLFAVIFIIPLRVHAQGSSVVISQLQTGGAVTGTASHEYVEFTNNTNTDVDVTGWCLTYASASAAGVGSDLTCFTTPSVTQRLYLSAFGAVRLASNEFLTANPSATVDATFRGSVSGTGGHVHVVDSSRNIVDTLGWGSALHAEGQAAVAPTGGQALQRKTSAGLYQDTQNNKEDFVLSGLVVTSTTGLYEATDVCINQEVFPGLQNIVPDGHEADEFGVCQEIPAPPECKGVILSEIVPNPSGTDTGSEYIELFNATDEAVPMDSCQLLVDDVSYTFTGPIGARSYALVTDMNLPNSSGATVRFMTADTEEVVTYPANMSDDEAWALLSGSWQLTNIKTPAKANEPSAVKAAPASVSSVLNPCPVGKVRNPETNRCRSLNSTGTTLQPCAADQIRNPETNRCRKITTASGVGSLTPCAPGQQRNPQTNRCRKIASAPSLLKPCDEGEERNPDTNRCRKVAGVAGVASTAQADTTQIKQNYRVVLLALLLAVVYGLYEYRQELRAGVGKIFGKVLRR